MGEINKANEQDPSFGFDISSSELEIISNAAASIRESYRKFNLNKLDQIQATVPIIVKYVSKKHLDSLAISKISKEQWTHVENAITSCYLRYWLRNDSKARQNLRSFIYSPFQEGHLSTEVKILEDDTCPYSPDAEDTTAKAYRNFHNYGFNRGYTFQIWRQEQAEEEGTSTLPLPKRGKSEWEIPCSYINLAFYEAFQKGELDLLKLAIESSSCLKNTTDRGSNLTLKSACDSLVNFARRIQSIGNNISEDNITACKHYVSSCMMICEFEESNRFILVSKIAAEAMRKKIIWKKAAPAEPCNKPYSFWGRYVADSRQSNNPSVRETVVVDWHRNLLNYDEEISAVFQGDSFAAFINWKLRNVLHDSLIALCIIFPIDQTTSWEKEDYFAAAKFYDTKFPIINMILDLNFPELEKDSNSVISGKRPRRKQDFYDLFRKIYIDWMLYDGSPLYLARKKFKQKDK